MTKAIFFDLFFTLIIPKYNKEDNEFDILNISAEEWESYAENDILYRERALGKVKSGKEIINNIIATTPYHISDCEKREILLRREERMKRALLNVTDEVLDTLAMLQKQHIKICLISNADVIDRKYWSESQLASYFDEAIFSCDVGLLKPDARIYELALKKVGVKATDSIFVGDGGSDELAGAKEIKMKTVFSEYLDIKSKEKREVIEKFADYKIKKFSEILDCI